MTNPREFTRRAGMRHLLALATLLSAAVPGRSAGQSIAAADDRTVLTSDSVALAVRVAGSGPPVLVLHGGPGQGTLSFEQMGGSALEAFATVIYLDQRGSGRSPAAGDYSLERMLRDIDEVRAALGHDRVHLLAHSFGGILAVNYAARHPERVAGVVMVAATAHFLADDLLASRVNFVNELVGRPWRADPGLGHDSLMALYAEARATLNAAELGYRFLSDSATAIPVMVAIDRSYPRTTDFGRDVMQRRAAYPEYFRDYTPLTAEVRAPALVIAGTHDQAIGPETHRSFRFPRQEVVELEAGHLLYWERTADFAAAVRDFLRRHAADPPAE